MTPTAPTVPARRPSQRDRRPGTGDGELDRPRNNGGSAITSYRVTPYIGTTAQAAVTVPAPAGTRTITGLTAGTAYTFKVAAVNAVGTGPTRPPRTW